MIRKSLSIIAAAKAHPEWSQAQVAAHCGSTANSVKVTLCKARQVGRIGVHEIDRARCHRTSLHWLPDRLRKEYVRLRYKVGANEARKMISEDLVREAQVAMPRRAQEDVAAI